jgi:hypothetical protein
MSHVRESWQPQQGVTSGVGGGQQLLKLGRRVRSGADRLCRCVVQSLLQLFRLKRKVRMGLFQPEAEQIRVSNKAGGLEGLREML